MLRSKSLGLSLAFALTLGLGHLSGPGRGTAQRPMRAVVAPTPQAPAVLDPVPPAPAPVPPPQPVDPDRPRTRGRGRKAPANLDALIAASHQRLGAKLRALPKATEPTWDSRTFGWVGPVKDQGQCGSCWDFSGTGVVEIAYNKAGLGGGANTFALSEQYTLGCGRNGGCMGDDNTTVLDWAKSTGLPLTSAYGPYTGGGGFFSRCNYNSSMALYKIPDWGFADSNGGQGVTSVADIKAAIKAYGCVGVAVAADNAFEAWGENNPSFNSPFQGSGSRNIDHDVILVGWQDDGSKAGGYWIMRNSWGPGWGVNGYMAIAYGANLIGTEAVFAMPPANPNPPPTPGPTPPAPAPTGLTYTVTAGPAGAAFNGSLFTCTFTATGPATVAFAVSNGTATATGSFAVTVNAAGPIAVNAIPPQTATVGVPFTLDMSPYVSVAPAPSH